MDADLRPHMRPPELQMFRELIADAKCYVEYGCGGSTLEAVRQELTTITSVETDLEWIQKIQETSDIRDAIECGRLNIIHADIGPVGLWGIPKNKKLDRSWLSYPTTPWNERSADADLVFIDGRFRVAAALISAIITKPGTKILVHDYEEREHYKPIETVLRKVDSIKTLAVFEKDKGFDVLSAMRLLTPAYSDYQ